MPIFYRTYRSFDGKVWRHFRWWQIVRQEWRIMLKSRLFRSLFGLSQLLVALHILLVYLIDTVANLQGHPWSEAIRGMPIAQVDEAFFLRFIRLQTPLVFITTILVGSRLICNDFRYNLVDIYFSKPLSWWDYVTGKVVTLLLVGFGMTVFPAWILLLLHVAFASTFVALEDAAALAIPCLMFGLTVSLPCALGVLASSAVFNGPRFASIAVFMVLMANAAFGAVLPEILDKDSLRIIAFPVALNRLGEWYFGAVNLLEEVSWKQSAVYVTVVCAVALAMVCLKVRRAGAAS